MKIVVLVKQVPDATADRGFTDVKTTDRVGVDGILSELDEYAIEEALQVSDAGDGVEVVVVTMGPVQASEAVRKGLQMGADSGVHVTDEVLAGSDAVATSAVLAAAIGKIGDVDLVVTGMASTDGSMSVVPAMLAERLGIGHVGFVGELSVGGSGVTARRDGDTASETVEAAFPVIVSVTDQINEPRYPSFKGIMAAKKKPVETWSVAELGLDAGSVGAGAAWSQVVEITKRPPRSQGEVVTDEGDGGVKLTGFLAAQKFV